MKNSMLLSGVTGLSSSGEDGGVAQTSSSSGSDSATGSDLSSTGHSLRAFHCWNGRFPLESHSQVFKGTSCSSLDCIWERIHAESFESFDVFVLLCCCQKNKEKQANYTSLPHLVICMFSIKRDNRNIGNIGMGKMY